MVILNRFETVAAARITSPTHSCMMSISDSNKQRFDSDPGFCCRPWKFVCDSKCTFSSYTNKLQLNWKWPESLLMLPEEEAAGSPVRRGL